MPQIPICKLLAALLNSSGFVQTSGFLFERYFDDAGKFPIVILPRGKNNPLSAFIALDLR